MEGWFVICGDGACTGCELGHDSGSSDVSVRTVGDCDTVNVLFEYGEFKDLVLCSFMTLVVWMFGVES